MTDQRDIGVALSGGGHRATIFGLGAMLAIADAGLAGRVRSISSVSGGSIANGVLLVGGDFGSDDVAATERVIASACRSIADRGILLGGAPATRNYLRSLIAALVITVVAIVVSAIAAPSTVGVAVVGLLVAIVAAVIAWNLFRQRSRRVAEAIDAELLGGRGTTLADATARSRQVHHVICTTELQSGTSLYLTNRLVYGWQNGAAPASPAIKVATAVQASAAVPGAFAPVSIDQSALGVEGGDRVLLSDGGVYDNMADEWEYGFVGRRKSWPIIESVQDGPSSLLIVVNGSGGWNDRKPVARGGRREELAGLLRAKDVQYDVSTAHRRRALMAEFRDRDSKLAGVIVQITASPFTVVDQFAPAVGAGEGDGRSVRSRQAAVALASAGYTPDWWSAVAARNSGIGTTLAPLGATCVAELLEHAHVLTTVQLYVIHGIGSLDRLGDRQSFSRLATGAER